MQICMMNLSMIFGPNACVYLISMMRFKELDLRRGVNCWSLLIFEETLPVISSSKGKILDDESLSLDILTPAMPVVPVTNIRFGDQMIKR